MKTGLLLEGGAMRGMYTDGVLDTLMEAGITTDGVMSVSAGALFGINFKSRQIGRALDYQKKYVGKKDYIGIHSLLTTGNIMNKDFCFDRLINELVPFDFDTFKNSPMEFYAVVTEMSTATPEYIKITDLRDPRQLELLRASASMPFLSEIITVDGKEYLDGGITDSIPIRKMSEMGYDRILTILTRPSDYRKSKGTEFPVKLAYHKYPNFARAINERYLMYNRQAELVNRMEAEGQTYVIRPSKTLNVRRFETDIDVLVEMYELGRSDAQSQIEEIRKYLYN